MLNTTYTEDITTGASITLLCLASAKFSDKKNYHGCVQSNNVVFNGFNHMNFCYFCDRFLTSFFVDLSKDTLIYMLIKSWTEFQTVSLMLSLRPRNQPKEVKYTSQWCIVFQILIQDGAASFLKNVKTNSVLGRTLPKSYEELQTLSK